MVQFRIAGPSLSYGLHVAEIGTRLSPPSMSETWVDSRRRIASRGTEPVLLVALRTRFRRFGWRPAGQVCTRPEAASAHPRQRPPDFVCTRAHQRLCHCRLFSAPSVCTWHVNLLASQKALLRSGCLKAHHALDSDVPRSLVLHTTVTACVPIQTTLRRRCLRTEAASTTLYIHLAGRLLTACCS